MSQVYIGLGANVGASVENLARACKLMIERGLVESMICSPLYHSPALLPKDAPPEWDMPFVNQVVMGNTALSPYEVMFGLQAIETEIGRQRRGHWAPREIDLDILSYDTMVMSEERLQLPHVHMTMRDFVLLPLRDIAPNWVHPVSGKGVEKLIEELDVISASPLPMNTREAV